MHIYDLYLYFIYLYTLIQFYLIYAYSTFYMTSTKSMCFIKKYKAHYYVRNICKNRSKNTKRQKQGNAANEKPLKTKSL